MKIRHSGYVARINDSSIFIQILNGELPKGRKAQDNENHNEILPSATRTDKRSCRTDKGVLLSEGEMRAKTEDGMNKSTQSLDPTAQTWCVVL